MTHVPPVSSLVFVVIVAVWAVYLVQHRVRRRDHLATARSVDRFSEAMRVLERRRALSVPGAPDQPRAYASSPLRPARPPRPEVVVKPHGAVAATAVAPSQAHRRARRVARVRAAALLLGSLAMVSLVGLAMAGVLDRWYAVVGVGAGVLAVAAVRWSVALGRTQVRAARPSRARPLARPAGRAHPVRSASSRPAARTRRPAAHAPGAPVAAPEERDSHQFSAQSVAATLRTAPRREVAAVADRATTAPAEDEVAEQNPTTFEAAPRSGELYDLVEVEAGLAPQGLASTVSGDVLVVQPTDGTWNPVPVPPPTYTLKARAYRGHLTGSPSLPSDGTEMALDEEFEELPRIDLVG